MTLAELLTTLESAFAPSRVKDLRTSLRYFAVAMGYDSPEVCPVDATCRDPDRWRPALETHFAHLGTQGRQVGAQTRANTFTNLRLVFRTAEAHGLLQAPLPAALLSRERRSRALEQHYQQTSPYRAAYGRKTEHPRYSLKSSEWPPDVQAGWQAYLRIARRKSLRQVTLAHREAHVADYLGYLAHVCGRTPAWDNLFDQDLLSDFLDWHARRVGRESISAHGKNVVITCATIAKGLKLPCALDMAEFRNTCGHPEELHDKEQTIVPLRDLEQIADACLAEGRAPVLQPGRGRHPGLWRALRFQKGVMLKILVRWPKRQRNIREIQRGRHLTQLDGHWRLRFVGRDLKVAKRGQETNVEERDLTTFCPDFIPILEEWLNVYRPLLPNADTSPYLFLTKMGRPYIAKVLGQELSYEVSLRLKIRWHPHLVRDAWASEYIEKTKGDFLGAAHALGNSPAQVQKTYYKMNIQLQQEKASAFNQETLL